MRVIRTTVVTKLVPIGEDHVVAWAPIPAGGKLLSLQGELHVVGAEAAPTNQFSAYGFSGEMVPVVDPDGNIAIDTLWDNLVTKPVVPVGTAATTTLDFDWDTVDADPDVEPGMIDLNDFTGLLDPTKEIFAPRIEWLSFAKGAPIPVVAGTPDSYTPRSFKTFRSNKTLIADLSSYAMLAISSPNLSQEEVAHTTLSNANQWAILSNLRNAMNDFWKIEVGLTEAGAETPYDTIMQQIENLVSPEMVNPSASLLDPMQFTAMCTCTFVIEIPDRSIPNTLDANNG